MNINRLVFWVGFFLFWYSLLTMSVSARGSTDSIVGLALVCGAIVNAMMGDE